MFTYGQMLDFMTSPVDPLFWMHHAYIDMVRYGLVILCTFVRSCIWSFGGSGRGATVLGSTILITSVMRRSTSPSMGIR